MHNKGSTFNPRTRRKPMAHFDAELHTITHTQEMNINNDSRLEPRKFGKGGKSGAEQQLIFRAPGRLLSTVSDGITSQKGHLAEFLNE